MSVVHAIHQSVKEGTSIGALKVDRGRTKECPSLFQVAASGRSEKGPYSISFRVGY